MRTKTKLLSLITLVCLATGTLQAQIGVNNSAATPNPSAVLDLNTGNTLTSPNGKGLLIPNVALTGSNDNTTITVPATSLLVYVPVGSGLAPAGYYYNAGTSGAPVWTMLSISAGSFSWAALKDTALTLLKDSAWTVHGNTGTTPGTNFIGTTDAKDFIIKTNNTPAIRVSGAQVGINSAGVAPNTSAILDLNTGNTFATPKGKGLLIPNVQLTGPNDAASIVNPAVSLLVYVPTGSGLTPAGYYYNAGTSSVPIWTQLGVVGGGSGWLLTGNVGTSAGTNFIGTNDANALEFKVNNTKAGWIDYSGLTGNIFFGWAAGYSNTTGSYNEANGYEALYSNTTGSYAVANGSQALYHNTKGNTNTADGYSALYTNVSGSSNTATGYLAGDNTVGDYNVFVGDSAGITNTTGKDNTAIGYQADVNSGTLANATAIGNGAKAPASNSITLGNTAATSLYLPGYSTVGDLLYTAASTGLVASLGAGSSGQVLQSNGAGSAPSWVPPSGGSGWLLTGDAGTTYGTNYIGTNDDQGLLIEVNGQTAGKIEDNNPANGSFQNTGLGYLAAQTTNGGIRNTALGYSALATDINGSSNIAIGYNAGINNRVSANVFIGDSAGASNTFGIGVTFVGYQAGAKNGTAIQNTAVGYQALKNSSGSNNTATGCGALLTNTTGGNNTANGYNALTTNQTGSSNTGLGYATLTLNTTGNNNIAIGVNALKNNTTGSNNTAMGGQALSNSNSLNSGNTALGFDAGFTNGANANVFIGDSAGYNNFSGTGITFVGYGAGADNFNATQNTAIGYQALFSNSIGVNNTATGYEALFNNTVANNTANGMEALYTNTTGTDNTADGLGSLYTNNGSDNTASGYYALFNNTSGSSNTAVGYQALDGNTTQNNNTALGYQADISGSVNNATAIGYSAKVAASNNMMFGNTNVVGWGFGATPTATEAILVGTGATNGNGANLTVTGTWTSTSDSTKKRDIKNIAYGLSDVMKLRPVSYRWKGTDKHDIGFLAQEVKLVLPEIVYGEEGHMTLSYGQVTPVLVKAIQEQQHTIDSLKTLLAAQAKINTKIANEMADLKEMIHSLTTNKIDAQAKKQADPAIIESKVATKEQGKN